MLGLVGLKYIASNTVERILIYHPFGHENMVSQG